MRDLHNSHSNEMQWECVEVSFCRDPDGRQKTSCLPRDSWAEKMAATGPAGTSLKSIQIKSSFAYTAYQQPMILIKHDILSTML